MAGNSTLSSPVESPAAADNDAKALEFIEEITKNAGAVQEDTLTQILTQNADTEYLRAFNLAGATDPKTFKSKIPMTTYEDFEPFIRRIANGDRSPILCAHPISEFFISTGTSSGVGKLFPHYEEESDRRLQLTNLATPIMKKHVKGLDKGKVLYFMFITKPCAFTPCGLPVGPTTTSWIKSSLTKIRPGTPYSDYTSPSEAILCVDTFQSMYTQMLCGLYQCEQVRTIRTIFASVLLQTIKFLQVNWQQLTHDIRTGSLNSEVTDESIRECMTRILQPNPGLAEFIAKECAKENWEGIITRIWPNIKCLETIITGSMAQYVPALDHYSGGLPKLSMCYGCSECFVGINLNPMCDPSEISYTIMPNMAYFEFLPVGLTDGSQLVPLVDVKVGTEYEIVVTTYTGLYRYQIGDILRVSGFHNSAPRFQFVRRRDMLLSVDQEKTDEIELQAAIERASELLNESNISVLDYTSYADTATVPGHYVLYMELSAKDSACLSIDNVLDRCCLVIEESLGSPYRMYRTFYKLIGALEIRVVKRGTFEELMNYAISKGASISQYKVPRCVRLQEVVDLLDSSVMSKHVSPSTPHWSIPNSSF